MVEVICEFGALERTEVEPGLVGFRSPALMEAGVPHAFTTRHDGGGLALEIDGSDAPTGSAERLHRLLGLGAPRTLTRVRQVHGAELRRAPDNVSTPPPDADAMLTEHADSLLIVRVADCVPVLIATRDGRSVAAVHAGWRGLIAGVLTRTLAALAGHELIAAIGPSISRERFEVGPEVARAFRSSALSEVVHEKTNGRHTIDLRRAARLQLERAGVRRIDETDRCTWRDAADFFSYRREVTHGGGESTGRMGAVIGVAPRETAPVL